MIRNLHEKSQFPPCNRGRGRVSQRNRDGDQAVSTAGRLFGSFVIIIGIGVFSLLTASFSAFLVSRDEKTFLQREQRILNKLDDLEVKLARIERAICMQMNGSAAQEANDDPAAQLAMDAPRKS